MTCECMAAPWISTANSQIIFFFYLSGDMNKDCAHQGCVLEIVNRLFSHGSKRFAVLWYNWPVEPDTRMGASLLYLIVTICRYLGYQPFVLGLLEIFENKELICWQAMRVKTVNDSRVLFGGGWHEMVMAKKVDELARKTPGKKSHAIDAFSRTLQAIPTIVADNAGLDSAELISQLRAEHHRENSTAGIDVITGSLGDMQKRGICEAFKVKQAIILSATEVAEMILRVDEIYNLCPAPEGG